LKRYLALLKNIFILYYRAIEAGANFLSEAFIFSVAASIIIAETWR
jgi:hypothetical protein